MTSIRPDPHHVVPFVRDETAPHDLTCPIGMNLMVRPVVIAGDTTAHRYDALAIKRALETNRRNPFTRAPVTANPALLPDPGKKAEVRLFRARVLGYLKVAAFHAEAGLPMPDGSLPVLPKNATTGKDATPREAVAARVVINAMARRAAEQPVREPAAMPHEPMPGDGFEPLIEAGMDNMDRALEADERARGILSQADAAMGGAMAGALAAQAVAEEVMLPPVTDVARAQLRLAAFTNAFESYTGAFNAQITTAALDLVLEPSHFSVMALTHLTRISGTRLADVMLFDDGRILRSVVETATWDALLPVMRRMTDGVGATTADGTLGLRWVTAMPGFLYAGELREGIPHGSGLGVDVVGESGFSVGTWQNSALHGPGRRFEQRNGTEWRGRFEHGQLREGVCLSPRSLLRGEFTNGLLSGWGDMTTPGLRVRGAWLAGRPQTGDITVLIHGERIRFADVGPAEAPALGVITYGEGGTYAGELRGIQRHGHGVLTTEAGFEFAGLWRNNLMQDAGAIMHGRSVRWMYADRGQVVELGRMGPEDELIDNAPDAG